MIFETIEVGRLRSSGRSAILKSQSLKLIQHLNVNAVCFCFTPDIKEFCFFVLPASANALHVAFVQPFVRTCARAPSSKLSTMITAQCPSVLH